MSSNVGQLASSSNVGRLAISGVEFERGTVGDFSGSSAELDGEVEVHLHWHPMDLVAAADRAGLDREEARAAIDDGRNADTVRNHQRFWLSKGIHAVPSFVLDQRYLIPGAQDSEVFVAALKRLRDEKAA